MINAHSTIIIHVSIAVSEFQVTVTPLELLPQAIISFQVRFVMSMVLHT